MTTNWSGRRAQRATAWVIQRDNGICWICGHPGADTLDHKTPRSIAPERTWDPTNWAAAHGAARPEHNCPGQYARGNYIGPRRPTTTTTGRLHIVIGPPCAGKTTHVHQHRQPGDLIIDTDTIATALGSPTTHTSNGPHARAARIARTALIEQTLRDKNTPAWIIDTHPETPRLDEYTRAGATLTLLDPGRETCLRRARKEREGWTIPAILDWYKQHADRLKTYIDTTPTTPATSSKREW